MVSMVHVDALYMLVVGLAVSSSQDCLIAALLWLVIQSLLCLAALQMCLLPQMMTRAVHVFLCMHALFMFAMHRSLSIACSCIFMLAGLRHICAQQMYAHVHSHAVCLVHVYAHVRVVVTCPTRVTCAPHMPFIPCPGLPSTGRHSIAA